MIVTSLLAGALATSVSVDRGQYTIHAAAIGSGKPMIALPGGPGFSGRSVWGVGWGMREQVKTYLFDQLGTGKSQLKDTSGDVSGTISLDGTLEDIEALRKATGHKKWIVFGQSWGVIVALLYAAKYPSAVAHLVLTSVPGLGHDGTFLSDNLRLPKSVEEELTKIELDESLSADEKTSRQVLTLIPYYFYRPEQGLNLANDAPADLFAPRVFGAFARYILNDKSYQAQLRKVAGHKYPVSMIQGRQDPCGAEMPFALRDKYVPRAKISLVAQSGHFAWMEQPDAFFYHFHSILGLTRPAWTEHWGESDHPAFKEELKLRTEANWPFGK
ncbi:MAG: alpha/beta hydrolase [Chthonomonas sp.]|nr:alpha/beta hydrolase [Chthonomonas sp.]